MNTLKISFLTILFACATVFAKAQPTLPANNGIDRVTNAYIELKNALVASDGNLTQLKAKDMLKVLASGPEQRLKPAQKTAWLAFADKIQFDTRHISETNAISHQREHFGTLSKNLFVVLKKLKLNSLTVYEQYCPMKKQMWISETVAIRNPYYGKEMLDCGTTRETL